MTAITASVANSASATSVMGAVLAQPLRPDAIRSDQ